MSEINLLNSLSLTIEQHFCLKCLFWFNSKGELFIRIINIIYYIIFMMINRAIL